MPISETNPGNHGKDDVGCGVALLVEIWKEYSSKIAILAGCYAPTRIAVDLMS